MGQKASTTLQKKSPAPLESAESSAVPAPSVPRLAEKAAEFDVFLSYAWGGHKRIHSGEYPGMLFAKAVYEALCAAGFRVWIDTANMGCNMMEIAEGMAASRCVVALVSEPYAQSKHCLREFECAMRTGKAVIVCLSDSDPSWFPKKDSELGSLLNFNHMPDFRAAAGVDWTPGRDVPREERALLFEPSALPRLLNQISYVAAEDSGKVELIDGLKRAYESSLAALATSPSLAREGEMAAAWRALADALFESGRRGNADHRSEAANLDLALLDGVRMSGSRFELRASTDPGHDPKRYIHQSLTSLVVAASYWEEGKALPTPVALKFMRNVDHYRNERHNPCRAEDFEFVVSVLAFSDPDHHPFSALERRGLAARFPGFDAFGVRTGEPPRPLYLVAMPLCDKTLETVIRTESEPDNWPGRLKRLFRRAVTTVAGLHSKGVVHGDVKPNNFVLSMSEAAAGIGGARSAFENLLLIDLDAARVVGPGIVVGNDKLSTAFVPPEALRVAPEGASSSSAAAAGPPRCVICSLLRPYRWCNAKEEAPGRRGVPAHPSWDMWGLGATLYYMLARQPLFPMTTMDNLAIPSDASVAALRAWSVEVLASKIRGVVPGHATDDGAADLLRRLLHPDPSLRLTDAASILSHPFLSGYKYDAFISYRKSGDDNDRAIAKALFDALSAPPYDLKVFFDDATPTPGGGGGLRAGVDFVRNFLSDLSQSRVFVPLVSHAALRPWVARSEADQLDNLFFEYRAAFELNAGGAGDQAARLQKAVPCFVGPLGSDGVTRGTFFKDEPSAPPAIIVPAVEAALAQRFESLGLPPPKPATAAAVHAWIKGMNGDATPGFNLAAACAKIQQAVEEAKGGLLVMGSARLDHVSTAAVPTFCACTS